MKLLILDRDGVINFDSDHYIKHPDEWHPLPGSIEAIARLTQSGWRIAVASNQSGIARGLFDMEMLNAMHTKMHKAVTQAGGRIEAVFYCPDSADSDSPCRKPNPGMLLAIAERFNTSLQGTPAVDSFPAVIANEYIQRLKSEIGDMQRQQAQLAEKYGERHPEMVKIRSAIQSTQAKYDNEVAKVIQSVQAEYQAALAQDPNDLDAKVALGAALRGQGNPRLARRTYREVLQVEPDHLGALFNVGVLEAEFLDERPRARTRFVRFLELAPRDHPKRAMAEQYLADIPAPAAPSGGSPP